MKEELASRILDHVRESTSRQELRKDIQRLSRLLIHSVKAKSAGVYELRVLELKARVQNLPELSRLRIQIEEIPELQLNWDFNILDDGRPSPSLCLLLYLFNICLILFWLFLPDGLLDILPGTLLECNWFLLVK